MTDLNDLQKRVEKRTQEMQRDLEPFLRIIEGGRGDKPQCLPSGFDLPAKLDPSLFWNSLTLLDVGFQYIRLGCLILNRLAPDDEDDPDTAFCRDCPSRDSGGCSQPCGPLENSLPKVTTGSGEGVRSGVFEDVAILRPSSSQDHWGELAARHGHFLTSKQLRAIELKYNDKLENHEIGKRIAVGERAVRAILARARDRLREAGLENFKIGLDMFRCMREER